MLVQGMAPGPCRDEVGWGWGHRTTGLLLWWRSNFQLNLRFQMGRQSFLRRRPVAEVGPSSRTPTIASSSRVPPPIYRGWSQGSTRPAAPLLVVPPRRDQSVSPFPATWVPPPWRISAAIPPETPVVAPSSESLVLVQFQVGFVVIAYYNRATPASRPECCPLTRSTTGSTALSNTVTVQH